MSLLPFLLFSLWAAPGHRVVGGVLFDGDIQHLAAAANMVYVSTEESLYQLTSRLTLVHSLRQRGVLQPEKDRPDLLHFRRVSESTGSNATLRINVLLPFVENDTLISCGVTSNRCGHCDVLRLGDISTLLHNETFQLGPLRRSGGSVASIVALGIGSARARYILTAVAQLPGASETYCASDTQIINLHNAYNSQYGGIFSLTDDGVTPSIKAKGAVEFVDAFQISGTIYVLANVRPDAGSGRVRLLWMQAGSNKDATFRSLRGVELATAPSGVGGGRLLASSVVPGVVPVLWCGLFTVDAAQTNTALLLFGISPDPSVEVDADLDICSACGSNGQQLKTLQPETVLFRWDNMTAVLAMKQKAWVVFFIGTGDGQLIKLSMDKGHRTSCPIMLYRANDDRQVFPKIHLDQVDRKHVYVPLGNELVLVPVSKCTTYTKVEECWSAQDPQCVWCGSTRRCTFEDDCDDSDWVSIPDDYQEKMVSYSVSKDSSGQITLRVQAHVTAGQSAMSNFTCQFSTISGVPCGKTDRLPHFPQCICHLGNNMLHAEGLEVSVRISIGTTQLVKQLTLTNCSDIRGLPTSSVLCQQCIRAGCGWNQNKCSWANEGVTNDSVCQMRVTGMNFSRPEISSITPPEVSFYGWNHAVLTGHNLSDVTGVRIQAHTDCSPRESPVWNNTGVNLTFHIPGTDSKGVVRVCALLPDGSCHGSAQIAYQSSPSCTGIVRDSTWFSGKRKVTITGAHLNFVEGIIHSHTPQEVQLPTSINYQNLSYDTLPTENTKASFNSTVFLKVANKTLSCHTYITYYPEPEFTTFRPIKTGKVVHITVEKKADKLGIGTEELLVWGIQRGKEYRCLVRTKETHNETDFFTCDVQETLDAEFQKLIIKYGAKTVTLDSKPSVLFIWVLVVLVLIICITIIVLFVYLNKQKKFTAEMNRLMENLELDIRNDIRQGFVDLQTEKADLLENVGAIPFLDYKHFASRIFFPESESLMTLCVKDIGQDAEKVQLDECCHGLSRLIQDQLFLTSMVHALEEQKSFTIKDKCAMASLLTVALHSNLSYLTEIMEALLKDLVQQNSNTQPKLLLRRTESTVEKLLTNWMSICLYGFLRESVGQHLFLMVSALTQQITKGPVDRVTEKALYTLNEDWLLWQAQDFTSLKLKVLFAVGSDGQVSEPLEVNSLSCDTVEQVKEKILSSFKAKFGFPYYIPLKDVCIEFEKDGSYVPLEEVDKSSDVIGELRMLNTLKHYKVPDGATIKVVSKKSHPPLSPQGSLKDEENFSGKYFHMIDPDVDEDQRKNPERKKLKLKEVHLTKLLSTKVAVHSFVENLFRSIWGTPLGKAPPAVKYFFDFLDSQAEDVKIVDPDVLHIWKTNSLPLRFWVNILKNPQFVFDMEKTPQLDGCLSVIAQAFMDSFSLTENPLGKHTPTNKLLYAKDIPKFKQEVKAYYRHIKDQSPITDSEFEAFLQEESKKHENEFNETAALRELYKFIQKYLTEIREKLNQNGAPSELVEQLYHVKNLFDGLKSCSWS